MRAPVYLASAVGIACVTLAYARFRTDPNLNARAFGRTRLFSAYLRTVGTLLWPCVLFTALAPSDHCKAALFPALTWSFAMWGIEAALFHQYDSAQGGKPGLPASLQINPASLTAIGFGMSSLVGSRPDSPYASLFTYAILGCFLLVLPGHDLPDNSVGAQIFDNVQRVVLHWCIGLLVAAVFLTHRSRAEAC